MRPHVLFASLLLLAGCNGGEGNSSAPVTSSTPVAPVTAPAGRNWIETVTKTATGYVQGNPNAPIKLVEYGSRGCPTCGRFAAEGVEPLRQKYISTGKVSYEYRDFLVHGAPDLSLSLLNQCVPNEAFFPVLDQMFANQEPFFRRLQELEQSNPQLLRQLQQLPPPQAAAGFADALGHIEFMKQRGVPEARARQCLTDAKAIEATAKVNADAANVHGVTGTPTFFLNDRKLDASVWAQVEPALQAAGAR
jgi:protein-disulfide isomerase